MLWNTQSSPEMKLSPLTSPISEQLIRGRFAYPSGRTFTAWRDELATRGSLLSYPPPVRPPEGAYPRLIRGRFASGIRRQAGPVTHKTTLSDWIILRLKRKTNWTNSQTRDIYEALLTSFFCRARLYYSIFYGVPFSISKKPTLCSQNTSQKHLAGFEPALSNW